MERDYIGRIIFSIFLMISITTVVLICLDKRAMDVDYTLGRTSNYSKDFVISAGDDDIYNTLPYNSPRKQGDRVFLRKTLDNIVDEKQAILFYSRHERVKVYVDDELRYEFGSEPDGVFGNVIGNCYNIVELDMDDVGKVITIELINTLAKSDTYCPEIRIGNERDCMLGLIKSDMLSTLVSLIIAIEGIIMIFINTAIKRFLKHQNNTFLYMGFTMLGVGVWSLSESVLLMILAPSAMQLSMLTFCSLGITLLPLIFFWRDVFHSKYNMLFNTIAGIALLLFVGLLALHILSIVDIADSIFIVNVLFVALFVILAIVAVLERKRTKEQGREFMVYGVFFVIAGAFVDMYRYYNDYAIQTSAFTKTGFVLYSFVPVVVIIRELTDQINLGKQVGTYRKIAYTDSLTGVGNRAAFNAELQNIPQNEYYKYSIVNFDVNDLKKTNDSFGHESGDSLIITAAKAISNAFEKYGNCYRTGGDEFIAVLYKCDEKMYKRLLKKMTAYLDEVKLHDKIGVKIASGYAEYRYDKDIDLFSTLKRADEIMYETKRRMKNGDVIDDDIDDESDMVTAKTSFGDMKILVDIETYQDFTNKQAKNDTV